MVQPFHSILRRAYGSIQVIQHGTHRPYRGQNRTLNVPLRITTGLPGFFSGHSTTGIFQVSACGAKLPAHCLNLLDGGVYTVHRPADLILHRFQPA